MGLTVPVLPHHGEAVLSSTAEAILSVLPTKPVATACVLLIMQSPFVIDSCINSKLALLPSIVRPDLHVSWLAGDAVRTAPAARQAGRCSG